MSVALMVVLFLFLLVVDSFCLLVEMMCLVCLVCVVCHGTGVFLLWTALLPAEGCEGRGGAAASIWATLLGCQTRPEVML